MNLQEIINRPNNSTFETKELEFVVESYIKDKKGVDVSINITKGVPINNMFTQHIFAAQVEKLNTAFDYAQKHYLNK